MPAASTVATARKPPPRTVLAQRKAEARSRTTNGGRFLANIDGRSIQARRMYDIAAQVATDLGGGERLSVTADQVRVRD
jgi:hypothetical protein